MTESEVRRAALYVRVSTEEQAASGVSLAAQEERLRAYCAARDWETANVYREDGASAKTLSRPALAQMREGARNRKFDACLVWKLDRLSRSVPDVWTLLREFERRHVALVSLSENLDASTAVGRMLINILGTFAQLERETIGERTSLALRHKRDRLEVYASVPYGFTRAGDRLHPHDRELGIVGRIYGLRAQGQSLRQIAASLNSARICTKLGRRWAPEQIRLILARASVYERFLTRATETGR